MIKVHYDPGQMQMTFSGHAEYAAKGEDIVCAAVSTLYNTLKMQKDVHEQLGYEDDHRMLFSTAPRWDGVLFDFVTDGIKAIAEQYPEYVEFTQEQ